MGGGESRGNLRDRAGEVRGGAAGEEGGGGADEEVRVGRGGRRRGRGRGERGQQAWVLRLAGSTSEKGHKPFSKNLAVCMQHMLYSKQRSHTGILNHICI